MKAMKDPVATIRYGKTNYMVSLNRKAMELLNSDEIVFDKKNFIIRIPTMSDTKTYKISRSRSAGHWGFVNMDRDKSDVLGVYLIEKEGDDFILTKKTLK